MAITERSRHELYTHLEETMGKERAMTLMEHLPPVGWADVATKQDLAHLGEILREWTGGRLEAMDTRLDTMVMRAELHRELRRLTIELTAIFSTIAGVVVAALKLG